VEIAGGDLEEQAAEEAEDGVADVAVFPRHGAGMNPARETVAHHDIGARLEGGEHGAGFAEIVAAVGVGHDDVAAAGGVDAGVEGVTVAALGDGDDAGAGRFGEGLGAVGAAVVGDENFTGNAEGFEGRASLLQTSG
jgi:hypothetical protein